MVETQNTPSVISVSIPRWLVAVMDEHTASGKRSEYIVNLLKKDLKPYIDALKSA